MKKIPLLTLSLLLICASLFFSCKNRAGADSSEGFLVMAYYAGNESGISQFDVSGLTHIIFSFCYLDGNRMIIRKNMVPVVGKLVSLKDENPGLRVLLALGGWGGCETCSEVFSSPKGRSEFAFSVRELLEAHGADGIDMDWDEIAHAPYAFSADKGLFVTYDNPLSVRLKTSYAKYNGLAGIMFWQLGSDKPQDGLLKAIYSELE